MAFQFLIELPNSVLSALNHLFEAAFTSSTLLVLQQGPLSFAEECSFGPISVLQISGEVLLHSFKFANTLLERVDVLQLKLVETFSILNETLLDDVA